MRIKKNSKSANVQSSKVTSQKSVSGKKKVSKYDEGVKHIRAAIDCLGLNCKDDAVAREAIANLGVIMFDLKGSQ